MANPDDYETTVLLFLVGMLGILVAAEGLIIWWLLLK